MQHDALHARKLQKVPGGREVLRSVTHRQGEGLAQRLSPRARRRVRCSARRPPIPGPSSSRQPAPPHDARAGEGSRPPPLTLPPPRASPHPLLPHCTGQGDADAFVGGGSAEARGQREPLVLQHLPQALFDVYGHCHGHGDHRRCAAPPHLKPHSLTSHRAAAEPAASRRAHPEPPPPGRHRVRVRYSGRVGHDECWEAVERCELLATTPLPHPSPLLLRRRRGGEGATPDPRSPPAPRTLTWL